MNTYKNPDVLITAGGTRESVDDVRYIGNHSGGKLGHCLATEYGQQGYNVLLLAPDLVFERYGLPEGVTSHTFTNTEDLRTKMLSVESARLVLHAAAVSDYTPELFSGKISSDEDELIIRLIRTPKILSQLRSHFGEKTIIGGFKLLSDVPEAELIAVGLKQIKTNQTDFCIANDFKEIGTKANPVRRLHIVTPRGDYGTIQDTTDLVAAEIARRVHPAPIDFLELAQQIVCQDLTEA